jgi:hypothetical protein
MTYPRPAPARGLGGAPGAGGDDAGSVRLEPGVPSRFVGTANNGPHQHGAWDRPLHVLTRA